MERRIHSISMMPPSAATYLCAQGHDLTTADGWTDAIYAYNHSDPYIRQVREQSTAYAATAGTTG